MSAEAIKAKSALVEEIAAKLKGAQSAVVVEYRGLSVAEMTELRNNLRAEDVELKVYKNSLVQRATVATEYEGLNADYLHFHLPKTPVKPLLQLFLKEANETNQGSKLVIDALANVLFIYILRHALQMGWIESGLLAAFEDKRLSHVLINILNAPQAEWNIELLAELASMSRANFCRVFQQKMQMPPKKFLNQIRLQQGAYLLKQTPKSVLEVALEIGYQSEAHFSKAFKTAYGITPSQYRK